MPLNLHLFITRPQAQAEAWSSDLVEQGLLAESSIDRLSLLEIKPLVDDESRNAIKYRIMDLDLYQKVIFVSQHAVNAAFNWIDDYWPQIPVRVDFLAIGQRTAKLLAEKGVTVADLAQSQTGAMTSEVLLTAPALQSVEGERILICRGRGGRTYLGDELSQRGARVEYLELYERVMPTTAKQDWAVLTERLDEIQEPIVMSFHSGETFSNFLEMLKEHVHLEDVLKKRAILLVPSARVKAQVEDAGFTRVVQAANATDAAMQEGLVAIAALTQFANKLND